MSTSAYGLLAPEIQRLLTESNWKELRHIQVEAIKHLLKDSDDLIIAAQTASGKTEAAFLPVLTKAIKAIDEPGIHTLYIAPLKALINDQGNRLIEFTKYVDVEVSRWHGDVSVREKANVRKIPKGVLLITPESLESCFINYGNRIVDMFSNLKYVIIDELHAFIGDVRGVHLRSLLSRIDLVANNRPIRIGLSATLSDFSQAKKYLNKTNSSSVRVVQDSGEGRHYKIGLRSYVYPRKYIEENKCEPEGNNTNKEEEIEDEVCDIEKLAEELVRVFGQKTNLIFSNSRGVAESIVEAIHEQYKKNRRGRDPFMLHHGSLSKDVREDVEKRLKKGEQLSVFCTSTLEMGIDIGTVYSVGQLGPPWTVASLVQRIGRSGRQDGESAILRMYALDKPLVSEAMLDDRLHPELLRSIALIELMLEGWLEPLEVDPYQFSTFIQQVLSILRQTGGTTAVKIFETLCMKGIFDSINIDIFKSILRSLKGNDIIEQIANGLIILSPEGERITHDLDFYAAFKSSEDFSIIAKGSTIGVLPQSSVPPKGEFFILNGQRWKVEDIEFREKKVFVITARGKKKTTFMGKGGSIHRAVMNKMKQVLESDAYYPYLHKDSKAILQIARCEYEKSGLKNNPLMVLDTKIVFFPWTGNKQMMTLFLAAKHLGIKCRMNKLSLTYDCGLPTFHQYMNQIERGDVKKEDLVNLIPDKLLEKYDEFVSDDLLNMANKERMLCFDLNDDH